MKIAAIVTTGQPDALLDLLERCAHRAADGAVVRVFFRDESIPALCAPEVAPRLGWPELAGGGEREARMVGEAFERLPGQGDAQLFACTSSMYLWGVAAAELRSGVRGRGLIAFLAEDLEGADEVWCV
jgi:peroxiredoxin family protein